jgi:ketosteroid isomerase-like protein
MIRILATVLVLAVIATASLCQEPNLPPAMASLVEAERAFAKACTERGAPEAFSMFFAEDSVNYQLFPERKNRPAPAKRPPTTLNWATTFGDVSQAGDLGYNTGPSLLTDQSPQQRPPRHGLIFTIWKKQADGRWKVVLDAGVNTPQPVADLDAPFQFARQPKIKTSGRANLENERSNLMTLDRKLFDISKESAAKAFLQYLSVDARVHRNNMMPMVGKDAIRSYLSSRVTTMTGEPINADVARSADLGYSYGVYELKDTTSGTIQLEKGLYTRVWKRDEHGRWRVVLDTASSVPGKEIIRGADGVWRVIDTKDPAPSNPKVKQRTP